MQTQRNSEVKETLPEVEENIFQKTIIESSDIKKKILYSQKMSTILERKD